MDLTKAGDLGLLAAQSKGKQSVLCKPKPLTVHAVYHGFKAIASEKGNKSMDKKVGGLVCPFARGLGTRDDAGRNVSFARARVFATSPTYRGIIGNVWATWVSHHGSPLT